MHVHMQQDFIYPYFYLKEEPRWVFFFLQQQLDLIKRTQQTSCPKKTRESCWFESASSPFLCGCALGQDSLHPNSLFCPALPHSLTLNLQSYHRIRGRSKSVKSFYVQECNVPVNLLDIRQILMSFSLYSCIVTIKNPIQLNSIHFKDKSHPAEGRGGVHSA